MSIVTTNWTTVDGLLVRRDLDLAAGTGTWTKPTPPAGYVIGKHRVVLFNGGQGGAKGDYGAGAPGGIDGGYYAAVFGSDVLPATVGYVVGAGAAGATSSGFASAGGVTSFGSPGDPWYLTGHPGVGVLLTPDGPVATGAKPGAGGRQNYSFIDTVAASTSTQANHTHSVSAAPGTTGAAGTHSHTLSSGDKSSLGEAGEPSLYAAGGAGFVPAGWWLGSAQQPTAGADADISQMEISGGAGGGGGGNSAGGAGGKPGGAGGGGQTGGPGAPGGFCLYTYLVPIPT